MIKKILNEIKYNYKYYIFLLIITLIFIFPFDYYVYSPGSLIKLDDRIKVENSYKSQGSFNLTYVTARKATIPTIILSYILPTWDMESIDKIRIGNENVDDITLRNQVFLKQTSYDAIIASFKEANIEYEITNKKFYVIYIYDIANTNIKVGDELLSINNVKIESLDDLSIELDKYKENDEVKIKVLRNNKEKETMSKVVINENKKVIGILITELKDINTSPKVEYIFKDNESGSSRGLMCALEIYNRITKLDLTKGDIIAGTGTIDEYGNVGDIDGVKYKLIGAVKHKAKVFIVPTGNYEEALKVKNDNNYDIELIKADNLHNVIEKLKERN